MNAPTDSQGGRIKLWFLLGFVCWDFIGIWDLVIGISALGFGSGAPGQAIVIFTAGDLKYPPSPAKAVALRGGTCRPASGYSRPCAERWRDLAPAAPLRGGGFPVAAPSGFLRPDPARRSPAFRAEADDSCARWR